MGWTFFFFFNSLLLGVGLAMDAFSVSLANGLHEPCMSRGRMSAIAGVYAFFQALMPLTGWVLVHTLAERFLWFQRLIPWIGGGLLLWIGVHMLWEGLRSAASSKEAQPPALGAWELLGQGVATSIDALSAGFALADYTAPQALAAALLIAAVTFVLCIAGLALGRRVGVLLRSSILGGVVLSCLGIEVLFRGIL